jgi:hypothetical protein
MKKKLLAIAIKYHGRSNAIKAYTWYQTDV